MNFLCLFSTQCNKEDKTGKEFSTWRTWMRWKDEERIFPWALLFSREWDQSDVSFSTFSAWQSISLFFDGIYFNSNRTVLILKDLNRIIQNKIHWIKWFWCKRYTSSCIPSNSFVYSILYLHEGRRRRWRRKFFFFTYTYTFSMNSRE